MSDTFTPDSYEQWHHYITVICQQTLTAAYIDERIEALNDLNDYMTQKFVGLYGEPQRVKTLAWFAKARTQV